MAWIRRRNASRFLATRPLSLITTWNEYSRNFWCTAFGISPIHSSTSLGPATMDMANEVPDMVTSIKSVDVTKNPPKTTKHLTESQETAIAQYGRGPKVPIKGIKAKRLRENMKRLERRYKDAAIKAKEAELLLEEQPGFLEAEGMER